MLWERLFRDRNGSAAPLFGLVFIPLMAAVGAAVDYSRAASVRTAAQAALDSTALALVKEAQNLRGDQVTQKAHEYFNALFQRPELQGLQLTAHAASINGGHAVTMTSSGFIKTVFMGVVGHSKIDVSTRGVASITGDGLGCVLALNRSASGAISGQGTTSVVLNGCSLYSNSDSPSSIVMGGSARLAAQSVGVVGEVSGVENIAAAEGIRTKIAPVLDPYADIVLPSFSGCTDNKFSAKSTMTINPGVYCNGMSFHAGATVTLNPGIYFVDRGSFSVSGGATVTGVGVTIVLTSSTGSDWAKVTINGGASVDLTPPASGPMAGIVMFGDRRIPVGTAFKFDGGASQYLGGAIYLPTGDVTYAGGASTSTSCTKIIADTIKFTGNSNLAINCNMYNTRAFSAPVIKLVS
jgi:Putative Flp pilus-assembly TadE/G-like